MPIQLDKILENIVDESVLHPNNCDATKQEVDEAWARVGRNNKLSVHESRSIFKVLQKKYEQEKIKGSSAWKLFGLMQKIHQTVEPKPVAKEEEPPTPMEEEEYEMFEVQEPEEDDDDENDTKPVRANSTGSASDSESPTKSMQSSTGSPDKEEKPFVKAIVGTPRPAPVVAASEEKKLLNSMANQTRGGGHVNATQTIAAALQKKGGITVKKTPNTAAIKNAGINIVAAQKSTPSRTTIQLPESLKRKLSEDLTASPTTQVIASKRANILLDKSPKTTAATIAANNASVAAAQLQQLRNKERETKQYTPPPGISIITVPAATQQDEQTTTKIIESSAAAAAANSNSTSSNGYAASANLQDINFSSNDIIFDAGNAINGALMSSSANKGDAVAAAANTRATHTTSGGAATSNEIINLGNFDNSLPPTFFKNLCNSNRHEALGLYVSNVMNRLNERNAARLEIAIVQAILNIQSDELEMY